MKVPFPFPSASRQAGFAQVFSRVQNISLSPDREGVQSNALVEASLKEIEGSIESFSFDVVDRLTDDLTQELLKKHREDVKILTSGSLSFLVDSIGKKLGIDICFGTDPEYLNGSFTGGVKGNPNFSDEKVRRIKYWMESKKFDEIYAYSDSIHDLPLLEFSNFPCAISPDKKLRKVAEDRKWLIEDRRNLHS